MVACDRAAVCKWGSHLTRKSEVTRKAPRESGVHKFMPNRLAISAIMQFLVALNEGDEAAALALLHDDPMFLDADGKIVMGRDACAAFVYRLCEYAERYRLDVHSVALSNDNFLIDGYVEADGEEFTGRLFAKITMKDGKLAKIQRFHGADISSLAATLAPELAGDAVNNETVH